MNLDQRITLAFNKLLKEMGNQVEFELLDLFIKSKSPAYNLIKRNIYLTKRIKRRIEDDGIFCSCSASPGSSHVCVIEIAIEGCKCGSLCISEPFQNRPVKKMKLAQTEKCGYGIVADEDVKKGEFVIEYVGEVIDDKTCEERIWKMKHRGEVTFYLKSIAIWIIDGEIRIGIFATRDIKKGEHLTYDYQDFGIIKWYDKYSRKQSIMFEDGTVKFLDMSKEDWDFITL